MTFKNFPVKSSPLTNIEIDDYAKKLNLKHYMKHRMLDEVKGKAKVNECGIINLDVSTGAGTHYVCHFKKGNNKIYFDSFGIKPPDKIVNYLKLQYEINNNIKSILCSNFRIQKEKDTNCGKYCLYVSYQLQKGYDFKDIIFDLLEEHKFEGV